MCRRSIIAWALAGVVIATPGVASAGIGIGDHYLCYVAKDLAKPPQDPPAVDLVDQFENAQMDPRPVRRFCTPASKNNEGIVDDVTHFKRYPLRRLSTTKPPSPTVQVNNQFGTIVLKVRLSTDLMVPTSKGLTDFPPPPNPTLPGYEHYRCYDVKPLIPFQPRIVTVLDQFGTRTLVVKRPSRLCNPVRKNAEPIHNPTRHLLCYIVTRAIDPPTVFATNQFGQERLDLGRERALCVPSLKQIVP